MATSVQYRLGTVSVFILIACAAMADAVTLIPFAGNFIGPLYWILVSVFLYTRGFGILNSRRFATSAISMLAEMVPAIQELPLLLAGTIVLIIFSRFEDKTGAKIPVSAGNAQQTPLNSGGVRRPAQLSENTGSTRQPLNIGGVRKAFDIVRDTSNSDEENPLAA